MVPPRIESYFFARSCINNIDSVHQLTNLHITSPYNSYWGIVILFDFKKADIGWIPGHDS